MEQIIRQSIRVSFEYPVVFTRDLFDPAQSLLLDTLRQGEEQRVHRALVFIDAGVAHHHPNLATRVRTYFDHHRDHISLAMKPRVIPGGEAVKNDYRLTMNMVDTILEHQLCRHSYVLAIGGGAVLDAVGFAASIVHRGLRMIRIPTTVLSQNDAGIGVKNGMNLHGGKNTIGTFHPPLAVLNDEEFLTTLSDEDWRAGISEAFKVALIKDRAFFEELCKNADRLRDQDAGAMHRLIRRCAELHLEHMREGGDPFELGTARPLDFGHWSAHKLETMSGYRVSHGHAVAVGIALDACYARQKGWLRPEDFEALYAGLATCGFPLWFDEMDRRLGDGPLALLCGLRDFQEHLGGALSLTMPDGLGARQEVHELDPRLVESCIMRMRDRIGAEGFASRS